MPRQKYKLVSVALATVFACSIAATAAAEPATKRLVLNFKGTGTAQPTSGIPNTVGILPGATMDANCFTADVFDLKNGRRMGTARDCLTVVAAGADTDSGSGVQVIGTTIFELKQGRLVVQGLTSVQAVNWPTTNSDVTFTHITGANSPNNAVVHGPGEFGSTKRFAKARGTVRLSGQVDLSQEPQGEITFDCIFVIDLDSQRRRDQIK